MAALVIGVGNSDRGDDGAGLQLVELLEAGRTAATRLHTARCQGDLTQLLDLWAAQDEVIVADMITLQDAAPGEVCWFDVGSEPLPYAVACSSHSVSLAQAIELARTLGRMPQRLQVVGIVGSMTELGQGLSAPVAAAVRKLAGQLLDQGCGGGLQHA